MYGKLNRSVATAFIVHRAREPAMKGWSMPAPAPWATTIVDGRPSGPCVHAAHLALVGHVDRQAFLEVVGITCHDARRDGKLLPGDVGIRYDGWKHEVFYPEGLKNREMLSYYSSQLNSVEINYTFRRFPTEKSLTTWREQAADGFVFTLEGEPADHALEAV